MINEAKSEIEIRFSPLISSGMLSVSVKGKFLTLSGKIEAVRAMDEYVMQKYIPTACKAMLRMEGNMDRSAIYEYKF